MVKQAGGKRYQKKNGWQKKVKFLKQGILFTSTRQGTRRRNNYEIRQTHKSTCQQYDKKDTNNNQSRSKAWLDTPLVKQSGGREGGGGKEETQALEGGSRVYRK